MSFIGQHLPDFSLTAFSSLNCHELPVTVTHINQKCCWLACLLSKPPIKKTPSVSIDSVFKSMLLRRYVNFLAQTVPFFMPIMCQTFF